MPTHDSKWNAIEKRTKQGWFLRKTADCFWNYKYLNSQKPETTSGLKQPLLESQPGLWATREGTCHLKTVFILRQGEKWYIWAHWLKKTVNFRFCVPWDFVSQADWLEDFYGKCMGSCMPMCNRWVAPKQNLPGLKMKHWIIPFRAANLQFGPRGPPLSQKKLV